MTSFDGTRRQTRSHTQAEAKQSRDWLNVPAALDGVQEEIRHRRTVLEYMAKRKYTNTKTLGLNQRILLRPEKVYERARLGLLGE